MTVERYGEIRGVRPQEDGGVLLEVMPEDARDWTETMVGAVVTAQVEDGAGELVRDMARFRGNLGRDAVAQLGELRPRLLEFLDRAALLAEERR